MIDIHMHTIYSDGDKTVEEVLRIREVGDLILSTKCKEIDIKNIDKEISANYSYVKSDMEKNIK